MDTTTTRSLIRELSEDLGWLEQHCRQQPELEPQAGQLRLAAALVRNTIGPHLDGAAPPPLHIAVVGGAGAGKSTVSNLLTGTTSAEANPQAGFTRHPIAYTSENGAITWGAHDGFLGPLQRLTEPSPSSLDKDVYQVRRIAGDPASAQVLRNYVVWDCPDMTTWAAISYIPRLLEVCGLADLTVYVASDERYNDEVPTQYLKMLLQAGKPIIVCLTKMREADAQAFLDHFKKAVLETMPAGAVCVLAIPSMSPAELAGLTGKAAKYRIPLLNQVAVMGDPPLVARARSVRLATNYLITAVDHLLSVARGDLAAIQGWQAVVQNGQVEFETRYRNEYLNSEKFHRFDEALVRLMELLELPGAAGQVVSKTLYVVRTPYRFIKSLFSKALGRPEALRQPELPVMEAALGGWLDHLRKEAVRESNSHPVWAHIERGFQAGGLTEQARERFNQGFRAFQLGLAEEVEKTARSIYEEIEKNPAMLNAMRYGKLALDLAAMSGAIITGGIGVSDLILVPLAASISHQLVEWLGASYVEGQKEMTRMRQLTLARQHVSSPLAEFLSQWPVSGGSHYERLQTALKRIPMNIYQLDQAVTQSLAKTGN
jgi:GTP-binding protein EngB required for normal cell division